MSTNIAFNIHHHSFCTMCLEEEVAFPLNSLLYSGPTNSQLCKARDYWWLEQSLHLEFANVFLDIEVARLLLLSFIVCFGLFTFWVLQDESQQRTFFFRTTLTVNLSELPSLSKTVLLWFLAYNRQTVFGFCLFSIVVNKLQVS